MQSVFGIYKVQTILYIILATDLRCTVGIHMQPSGYFHCILCWDDGYILTPDPDNFSFHLVNVVVQVFFSFNTFFLKGVIQSKNKHRRSKVVMFVQHKE